MAFKARWCDHTYFFRRTVKNLVAYATSWSLTLSPDFQGFCLGKQKPLTAKRITSPCGKKKKTCGKKRNLTAKRRRLKTKRKPHGKKEKTRGKISSLPRGHFNSYFFCREVTCNCFIVTVVGHRTFEFLFPKILDFSTCGYL